MYKTRLKRWNFFKNIRLKALDTHGLLRQIRDDHSCPRDRLWLVNGRLVETRRLEAHLVRRTQHSYRGPEHKGPGPLAIKPPDTLFASESVMLFMRDYIRGRHEDAIHTGDFDRLLGAQAAKNATNGFRSFLCQVELAFEEEKVTHALVAMRNAPAEMAQLMRHQPSALISMLCWFIVGVLGYSLSIRGPFMAAVRALIRYAATFAASADGLGLHSSHPLVGMLWGLLAVGEDMIRPLALKGWRIACSTFEQLLLRRGSVSSFDKWLKLVTGYSSVDEMLPVEAYRSPLSPNPPTEIYVRLQTKYALVLEEWLAKWGETDKLQQLQARFAGSMSDLVELHVIREI